MQLLDPGISVSQASSHKKRATVRKQVVVHKRPRSEAGNLDLPAEIFAMVFLLMSLDAGIYSKLIRRRKR